MAIHIIHHMRTKGKENTVYVGRPSVLGNPFSHLATPNKADIKVDSFEEAVLSYQDWLDEQVDNGNEAVINALVNILNLELNTGIVHLACWCKDELNSWPTDHKICHADVIRNFIYDEIDALQDEE